MDGPPRTTPARATLRIVGDVPIYVARDGCDHRAHPELFLPVDEVVAGAPPDGMNAARAALGESALRLARARRDRLPLVDRADETRTRARRPLPDRPLSRLRRLLDGACRRRDRPGGLVVARPGRGALRRGAGRARPAPRDRGGPRLHHARRPRATRRARLSRAWSSCSGRSRALRRTSTGSSAIGRTRSSTRRRTTPTRSSARRARPMPGR